MFFDIPAIFAEFEVDLLRLRTREGMAVARAKGKLRGKQPKLSTAQQAHLVRLHGAGEHSNAADGRDAEPRWRPVGAAAPQAPAGPSPPRRGRWG
jgi:DNA invertase Pin-like site-specific DNA recombinase